ncbi:MAG: HAMP domain-containing histidine kinase [Gemmatimonadetes bacterium]|nr:HAMP domain-containing histidine kinase [Gemmatimonadota bacterium]
MLPVRAGVDSPIPSLLGGAAVRVSARADELVETGLVQREDLDAKLDAVSSAVGAILEGVEPDESALDLLSSRSDVRLIHAVRAELLRMEIPPSSTPELLAVLRAVEALFTKVTREDPDDLETLMLQPDAFEVLLEIAHDLRSPLTSILFLAETLRGKHSGELNDVQQSQLSLIYSAALGLASITSDVVDLARHEQWWVDQGAEAYSIEELLRGVEEMVRPMAEEKKIDLFLSLPPYDRAFGHPIALSRVLLNLTTNAIKFTDKGFVELGAKRNGRRHMEFFVRDTGRGIAPGMQEQLFRPMKKRQGGQGQFFSGAGLGLSIARRILRSLGADLQLESKPEWGSRFYFLVDILPLA